MVDKQAGDIEQDKGADKDYLTTREVADLLGISVRSVQLWVENDVLQAWKTAGGHRRITRASVEGFINRQNEIKADDEKPGELVMVVVEDQLEILELYRRQIAGWGLPVRLITATNGIEGLYRIGQTSPDLIITDLRMPGLDGVRMTWILSEEPTLEHIRIVVVTSLTREEIEEQGGLPDSVDMYEKPIPFDKLRIAVLEQMSRRGIPMQAN